MILTVAAIGRRMPAWVDEAWREYSKRFPRNPGISLRALPAERRGTRPDLERIRELEGERLLGAVGDDAVAVALDGRGTAWTTAQLARQLEGWMRDGRDACFMVGGPDGLAGACLARADVRWSLGPLTLPHPLVRVIVVEQLYRALSIVSGHPYHRA